MKLSKSKKNQFLLLGYLIGYVLQIVIFGVPNWKYLLPLRVFPLLFVGPIGLTLYDIFISKKIVSGYFESMKYAAIAILLLIVILILNYVVMIPIFGFDLWPYVGIPN